MSRRSTPGTLVTNLTTGALTFVMMYTAAHRAFACEVAITLLLTACAETDTAALNHGRLTPGYRNGVTEQTRTSNRGRRSLS